MVISHWDLGSFTTVASSSLAWLKTYLSNFPPIHLFCAAFCYEWHQSGCYCFVSFGETNPLVFIISTGVSGLPRWLSCKESTSVMQKTQETWVWSLGREDPLEEGVVTHTSILAWRIPWTKEPGRLQSTGRVSHNWSDQAHAIGAQGYTRTKSGASKKEKSLTVITTSRYWVTFIIVDLCFQQLDDFQRRFFHCCLVSKSCLTVLWLHGR